MKAILLALLAAATVGTSALAFGNATSAASCGPDGACCCTPCPGPCPNPCPTTCGE